MTPHTSLEAVRWVYFLSIFISNGSLRNSLVLDPLAYHQFSFLPSLVNDESQRNIMRVKIKHMHLLNQLKLKH